MHGQTDGQRTLSGWPSMWQDDSQIWKPKETKTGPVHSEESNCYDAHRRVTARYNRTQRRSTVVIVERDERRERKNEAYNHC